MTTIAYKDGIIAYDSRLSKGDIILNDNYDKKYFYKNHYFFCAGVLSDVDIIVKSFFNEEINSNLNFEIEALVVSLEGKLFNCSFDENNNFWNIQIPLESPIAIGSGFKFALMAMDCGFNAIDAIIKTIKRDLYSGGEVKFFEIKEGIKLNE